MMHLRLVLLLLPLARSCYGYVVEPRSPICRCRPSDNCWPSQEQWQALNNSVDGALEAVRPVAAACFQPSFNSVVCNAARDSQNSSVWRTSHPGAVQWTNWEAWPEKNQSCYFDQPSSIPCGQGRVSLFSAVVGKPEHIQEAVRFAAKNNLRLAIKNTGHCFLGRSTAPESLQIATYKLKDVNFTNNFVPKGAPACHGSGPAVTIGAGVQLKDLYVAAAKHNVSVVAGVSHTVGAAGGYIQGGGHSPLGNWKGMASDNALQFEVVKANGDLATANAFQNQDLFWALRGGGGGTFGVVVSVTIRTFPDAPLMSLAFVFNTKAENKSAYWDMVTDFHDQLANISSGGGSGYYSISGKPMEQNGTQVRSINGGFLFIDKTDRAALQTLLKPLEDSMRKNANGPGFIFELMPLAKLSDWFAQALTGDYDPSGGIALTASRLISRDFLTSRLGPRRLSTELQRINDMSARGVGYTGHFIAGGAASKTDVDSALNPAWRKTITHIAFGVDWNTTTPLSEQKKILDQLTNVQVEHLRKLEPHMGAYLNEADPNEKNFQQSFWGDNYDKLYKFKQQVDPHNLFIVRRGVGSEDWDDDGLCRLKKMSVQ